MGDGSGGSEGIVSKTLAISTRGINKTDFIDVLGRRRQNLTGVMRSGSNVLWPHLSRWKHF